LTATSTKQATTSHFFLNKININYLWKMKKSKIRFEVFAHIIGWLIFLVIPLLFTPQLPPDLKKEFGKLYLIPVFTNSFILIILFYFNYFFLIPKYLFTNRYLVYISLILVCIGIKLVSPAVIMLFFDQSPPPILLHHPPAVRSMLPLAFSNSFLMYIVIILAGIGLRLNNRWKITEQERLQSELSSLKSQINPHFLFNTLNSIYAETLGKANTASDMILKLSDMMRYTTTEAHIEKVPLQKELDYISNYIELQKLRLASKAKLEYHIDKDTNSFKIAPFLLIPFIENAFKYGVNSEQNSSIRIKLKISNTELTLSTYNKKVDTEETLKETFGLGIKNTKQRLSLIYPEKHLLTIIDTEKEYFVSLYIKFI